MDEFRGRKGLFDVDWWKHQSHEMIVNYRWRICFLLFFVTTINYVDRAIFGVLVPVFEDELKMGPTDLAFLGMCFTLMYGFGMIFVGRLIDHVGTRKGLTIAFSTWNIAAMGHALVTSIPGFAVMRTALAAGESGNFPAAIKTIAEWFPQKERALATGLFNCGTNIGQVIAPAGMWIALVWGWRECFFILGAIGFIGVFLWQLIYRPPQMHPKVSPSELAYIQSDPPDKLDSVPYVVLLQQRQVWGISISRLFSDGPWWLYLLWTSKFLVDKFHFPATAVPILLAIVYLTADFGAIIGGWISTHLIKKGKSVNYARKFALFCCACGVAPVMCVGLLPDIPSVLGIPSSWIAVALIALAASSHQGWSSNMFTAVSDTLPKSAVAMTVGVASAFGAMGAALLQFVIGVALRDSQSYFLPFFIAGCTYFVAWFVFHLFLPKMEVANIDVEKKPKFGAIAIWTTGIAIVAVFLGMQYMLMQPEFKNQDEFLAKHATKIKAVSYAFGPTGKVGWRDAKWLGWKLADGKTKVELVTFDRYEHPSLQNYSEKDIKDGVLFIQNKAVRKGDRLNKYDGPSMADVKASIDRGSWSTPPKASH